MPNFHPLASQFIPNSLELITRLFVVTVRDDDFSQIKYLTLFFGVRDSFGSICVVRDDYIAQINYVHENGKW